MSVPFHPDTFAFAVVEYLDSSQHLQQVVDHAPDNEKQCRLVCVAHTVDGAWKIAHLLRAVRRPPLIYSVAAATQAEAEEPPVEVAGAAHDAAVTAG
jgi:hypothetical protein